MSGCTGSRDGSDESSPDAVTEEETVTQATEVETSGKPRTDREALLQQLNTEYNTLQTITILGKEKPEGSAGSSLQPSEDDSEFPYIMLSSTLSSIVLRGWASTDLSPYVPNGYISVEVKGTSGGRLEIGFERMKNGQSVRVTKALETEITGEWKTLTVPLAEIADGADLSSVRQFLIGGEDIQVRNITISSPDREKSFPEFKVNQLGYKPSYEKRALVSGFPESLAVYEGDSFELVDKATGEVVFSGQLSMVSEFDGKYSGEQILCADFSDFSSEGRYYLRADGIGDSVSFEISENVYDELLKNTMRYYYYQRANEEITAEYGGKYTRSDMTPKDFEAPLYYDRSVKIDVSGGWYDAGDIGKYVSPGATAANSLLWTYLMFPDCFTDGQNNIPESGNGIPDILDEVRVELDFLMKMQDRDSGGFYIKVKSRSENDDDGDRTVWVGDGDKCITNATADCTAVLAFASKIFREHDADYADKLLAAAERGWAYIEANPNVYTVTNYSGENNSSSAFWASACVYYAAGSESAHNWFLKNSDMYIGSLNSGANGHNVGNMSIYGYFTYLLCENRNEEVVSEIAVRFEDWKRSVLERYNANPWRIAINEWSFWWGSFNIILGNAQDMYIGCSLLGLDTSDAVKVSHDAVNFITGMNAVRKCFITGMGEDPIKCTFSNIYYGDSPDGVPAGYMPGGVNSYNGGIISRFPLKCYYDSPNDWFTNENAIYWNAVMVFNSALAVSR